ncbi:MAG TPA: type 4a pilus biogenesis protein PilO [Candidatus Sulfotelmatobacter sp.]|nr:type 4a pilus biogenesis protein PilO [Candidatus Sulfotelmatobacter sp.]
MPDLRQTRKKIQRALAVMVGLDVLAVAILISPLIGSADSRRQELNRLWSELRLKTRQVEPLNNLDKKVVLANQQIADFYKQRFPSEYSQILVEFGKMAASNGVTIEQVKYTPKDADLSNLQTVEMEANLAGSYRSVAQFINALERSQMFFIIDSIGLGGEQQGPVKLSIKVETYLKTSAS